MSNEEKILDLLQTMQTNIQGLQEDVKGLQGDVKELNAGQTKLQEDVKGLKAGQSKLQEDVKGLNAGQTKLQEDVKELKAGQTKLKTEIMHEVGALVEADVTPKFNLLADGIQLIREQMVTKEDLEERQEDIQTQLDVLKAAVRRNSVEIEKLKKAQ